MIKAISFDMWDTILNNSSETDASVLRKKVILNILEKINVKRELSDIDHAFSISQKEFGRKWAKEHLTIKTSERVEIILNELNIKINENLFYEAVKIFESSSLMYPPKIEPILPQILKVLSENYKLAIISDAGYSPGRILRKILEKKKILKYFSAFSFSDEIGCAKPESKMFYNIIKSFNIKSEELVHIGDLENTDIIGAKNIGAKSILYTHFNSSYLERTSADKTISSFIELPTVIKNLNKPTKKNFFNWLFNT